MSGANRVVDPCSEAGPQPDPRGAPGGERERPVRLAGGRAPGLARFSFGDCKVDVATRSLTRDGQPVKVEPRVFDLLIFLLEHRDRVVTSDELLRAVWGGVAVTPSSLSRAVHKGRRAVGDDGEKQELIATLHGRGFRLVAPVRSEMRARLASAEPDERGLEPGSLQAANRRVLLGDAVEEPALRRARSGGRRLARVSSPSRGGPANAR